ncbi:MAG: sigma-70 family RNA polymerase sigma factor [Steroidobacteraceae bacterium]
MNDTSTETDTLEQLLSRTAIHDRAAFAELYRQTSPRLFGLCVRMLGDRGEAEEVLQEAFIAIWRRAGGYNPALASAGTWLTTLVRNRAIDRLRQRRADTHADPLEFERLPDEGRGPAAHAEASEDYRRLERCLGQLDPKHSRSVREAFFTGATYKELAMRCQVPLATMKSWIRRALLQLRTCLET